MRLHSLVIAGIYLAGCGGCSNAAKPDTVAMLGDMTPSGLTGDRAHLYVTGYTNADEFGEVREI